MKRQKIDYIEKLGIKMKRKITIISLVSFLAIFLALLIIDQYDKKQIDKLGEKLNIVKVGMKFEEVIKIFGKPESEWWVDNDFLKSKMLDKKYKRALILTFCPKLILRSNCDFRIDVFFNKRNGVVIAIQFFI